MCKSFAPATYQHLANAFNRSLYAKYLVIACPPHLVTGKYNYDVTFMNIQMTSSSGGSSRDLYFYARKKKGDDFTTRQDSDANSATTHFSSVIDEIINGDDNALAHKIFKTIECKEELPKRVSKRRDVLTYK